MKCFIKNENFFLTLGKQIIPTIRIDIDCNDSEVSGKGINWSSCNFVVILRSYTFKQLCLHNRKFTYDCQNSYLFAKL